MFDGSKGSWLASVFEAAWFLSPYKVVGDPAKRQFIEAKMQKVASNSGLKMQFSGDFVYCVIDIFVCTLS